jgi:hypothetical protein
MGFKDRILRRSDAPLPDGETALFPRLDEAAGQPPEHPLPAAPEHEPQGDPLTQPHPAAPPEEHPLPAEPEHEPQGDPLTDPQTDAPAAVAYAPAPQHRPGFRERGRLRRRLRFLREARELGYRDIGGLVVDQHRFQRPNAALVADKVAAVDAIDRELRAIEDVLGAHKPYEELFVPGVSACQRCGALHGTDARFCPHCGLDFSGPRPVAGVWAQPPAGTTAPGYPGLPDPAHAETPAPPA